MAKSAKRFQKYSKLNILILAASLFILSGSLVLWWTKVFKDPQNVFETMLNNNLRTPAVVRQGVQDSPNGSLAQRTQLSFGSKTAIHSITNVKQPTDIGENSVDTETIAGPTKDFVRYTNIQTQQKNQAGEAIDFSSILGVWATQDGQKSQFFPEAILNIFIFGNVPKDQRPGLSREMKEVYEVDYRNVRQVNQAGRVRYIYDITVQPSKFINLFKDYAKAMNLTSLNELETQNFQNAEPIKLTITVDLLSRQLVGVLYGSNQTSETYNGHGLSALINEPTNKVTIEESAGERDRDYKEYKRKLMNNEISDEL